MIAGKITLSKLHKITLSGYGHFDIISSLLLHMCKNCEFLEDIVMLNFRFLTQDCIASAIRQRPTLSSLLRDKSLTMFTSIFPNLRFLDLSDCPFISEEVAKFEVLNLSDTSVDDETLYVISNNCRGLLELLLKSCNNVTKKGVKHVVENCKQLREIDLGNCDK
ncbi:F-box/LRR-repeat protein, partial [Trifolium medium]|nr:F-box/LRR-repeat protein [Trifolium medium]